MTAARAGAFDAVLVATRADLAHDEAEFDHVLDAMTEVRVRVIAIGTATGKRETEGDGRDGPHVAG